MKSILSGVVGAAFLALPAAAQETPVLKPLTELLQLKPINAATASGTYAGTFLCSLGEMGMTLTLNDIGSAKTAEDIGQMPCKTGSGPCNDKQNMTINRSRTVNGILNFFPVVGNPNAPAGVFSVKGSVNYSMEKYWRLHLDPSEWLVKPDNFGWSGLQGMIHDGKISGKPTAQGCHTLDMTKIRTAQ